MFDNLFKAAVGLLVETPASIVADFVTLGGNLTDKEEHYTKKALKKVMKNIEDACE